jgi:hypothetical protein
MFRVENRRFVYSALGFVGFVSLFVGFLALSGKYFTGLMGAVAPGVSYQFGSYELECSEQVLPHNGERVTHVYEPRGHLTNSAHASVVEHQLQAQRTSRSLLTRDDVQRGYSSWLVSMREPPYNYTFGEARKLARAVASSTGASCVCYAFLGIADNIVMLRNTGGEVLYEPHIVTESKGAQRIKFKEPYPLMSLLKTARVANAALEGASVGRAWYDFTSTDQFELADRGLVEYITESGQLRRREFDREHFPCIKYCVSFFEK